MNRTLFTEIIYIIVALSAIVFIGFIASLFYLLFGWTLEPNVYYASFTLVGAIFILILATTLPWKKVRKGALLGGLAVFLAGVIAICACVGYNSYMDSLVVIDNSAINTQEYLAFHPDSKIARLDHEASLRFSMTDNLPVLDGAAAFFNFRLGLCAHFVVPMQPKNAA